VAADASLAGVCALPILVQAHEVCGLKCLEFPLIRGCADRDGDVCDSGGLYISAKVVIGKHHLLDTVEPHPGVFVVDGVRRHAGACRH